MIGDTKRLIDLSQAELKREISRRDSAVKRAFRELRQAEAALLVVKKKDGELKWAGLH